MRFTTDNSTLVSPIPLEILDAIGTEHPPGVIAGAAAARAGAPAPNGGGA